MRLLTLSLLILLLCVSVLGQDYTINTFAGGGLPENMPAISAMFGFVEGVAVDHAGNLFIPVPDYAIVVRMDQNGFLTRVAGNGIGGFGGDGGPATEAQLLQPNGLAVDAAGNLYIADYGNNRVRKVSNGIITTVAGNGFQGPAGDGGPATQASLGYPMRVAVDGAGNLYIADTTNNCVRKVSNGIITTVVGYGTQGYSGDGGPATSAWLHYPEGVAVDAAGDLYISDTFNNVIRKVSNGVITTVAGNGTLGYGGDGGPGTSASLYYPGGIALDASGSVFIADEGNCRIRKLSNGSITTVAGNGSWGWSGDNGPATSAEVWSPEDVAVDASGNLYFPSDSFSGFFHIRKVSSGVITTVAGGGFSVGDNGPSTSGQLFMPQGLAVDVAGNVYIADSWNDRIRKVSQGIITTVAGTSVQAYGGDGGPAAIATLSDPSGVAVDSSGSIFIADTANGRVRKVANGIITTVAGDGGQSYSGDGGPATSAGLSNPAAVAVDAAGAIYIADGNRVRKVAGGIITTVAGDGTSGFSGDGGPATSAQLNGPTAVAVDAESNIYIVDAGNVRIREVSNGVITTVAQLNSPRSLAVDSAGNLYVGDGLNVRKISGGVMTTIAGNGTPGFSGDGGPATSAALSGVYGMAVDIAGNVYISDGDRIRILVPSVPSLAVQGASFAAAAGGGSIPVTAPSSVAWTATSNDSWITITNGASGTGSGSVSFSLQANTGAARSGTITIAGQMFTIEQESASTVGLSFAGSLAQIASAGGWDTSLTLVNLGTAPGEALLNFFANDGSTPLLPFTFPQQPSMGTILGATFDENLNANATLVLDTTGPATQTAAVGWSELLASQGIDGFAIFTNTISNQEAVVPLETRNAGSYVLAFDNTGIVTTGVAITNLIPWSMSVGVVIRDDTGAQIGTGAIHLDAQGHNSFMMTDATYGFPITASKRGTMEFDTPHGGRISVLGLRANVAALTSLPVLANVGTTGGIMPHVASGGGWQTIFTLVNTGATSANATLNFFDDNGSALSLPLSFPQTGATVTESTVSQALAAGATLVIVTQGLNSGNSVTGSAQLTTNGNIGGFAIFQNTAAGQEAVVPLEAGSAKSYTLAFDNTNNLATGVALANVTSAAVSVNVIVRDATGAQIGTGTIGLAADNHESFMLTDATQGFPVTAGIRGTVEFDTPSAGQIGAVGIRATVAGAFTTIPVMTK
ncbi:MAG: BACON domain-containing carbohydrate-binding protein [Bryobacteraceae bacterium]